MYVLRGVTGEVFGRTFQIDRPTKIGRLPECDIFIDDPGLSREHAHLIPLDDGLRVEDASSTNGTFINELRIGGGTAVDGDELRFDRMRFRVELRSPHRAALPASNTERISPQEIEQTAMVGLVHRGAGHPSCRGLVEPGLGLGLIAG